VPLQPSLPPTSTAEEVSRHPSPRPIRQLEPLAGRAGRHQPAPRGPAGVRAPGRPGPGRAPAPREHPERGRAEQPRERAAAAANAVPGARRPARLGGGLPGGPSALGPSLACSLQPTKGERPGEHMGERTPGPVRAGQVASAPPSPPLLSAPYPGEREAPTAKRNAAPAGQTSCARSFRALQPLRVGPGGGPVAARELLEEVAW
jgi:hypothetical protein